METTGCGCPPQGERPAGRVLWGVSFDAVPLSGVIVEFLKVADAFREHGFSVHLDLGYDIKADKNSFFKPYGPEAASLPSWVHLDRVDGLREVAGYDDAFVRDVLEAIAREPVPRQLLERVDVLSRELTERIVRTWDELDVSYVVVENGTLPENITYTRALYAAIEEYGTSRGLGEYVLWRDHDLMWSSEPGSGKYGTFPYTRTVRPVASPFIRYVTLHDEARRKMLEWVPELGDLDVLPNTFSFAPAVLDERNAGLRARFGVPEDAYLIARPSRIIPQKRVDRDIHLLASVNARLATAGAPPAYLLVAGDPEESPSEYARLVELTGSLGVRDRVVFAGSLAPLDVPGTATSALSVRDLLAHADLLTFLTSYDYESYGNPIGEAIASGVPYAATRYQLYDTVYGNTGFRAPIMEISADDDGLPSAEFAARVTDLLLDEAERREIAKYNHELGRLHFAPGRSQDLVRDLCRRSHVDRE
jgi:glycosyltransferase involved in cell wall biosynthesis